MLSNEETILLIRQSKNGNNFAKEKLILNNFGLIKSIANRFLNKGVEYDDLFQIGSIGFLKAIEKFDESFMVKFSTYAVPMIMGEIKRFLRDDGAIKVSRIIKVQAIKINKFIEYYKHEFNQEPKICEIAKHFNMTDEEVVLALDSNKIPISINDSQDDNFEKGIELIDKIQSTFTEEKLLDKIMFESLINELPNREKMLIIMRFYRDKTQSETAKILGISQVQVSRLESKILNKFKKVI